eukprot:Blabericola_migrator_1__167@NODE_1043_length_5621_cov_191_151602_g718_i0_p1_GENE_NODE_1043_length_5621_cov_191_151602_g718_i0NODE_1043_length_5621_cov_191_151602_g718_i0_p1_ORF_typecomplete_len571_score116_34ANAPC4_WD40/PF12894_7/0_024ANAPC4_WD40/PF12894_7/5_5e11ANAPC4_WD40/PF12894_7/0_041ANAPC4_WD40/PF12894_7/0_023ANAPC4_WD40/PF12894_7/21WD40/PF00400_32/20WD40/PF00400_32/1_3e05WD40/PF00400_32/0_0015WD40/PF00400_32/0_2LisH_TPL/PF17814_1/1_9e14WD40_like/PF17005_5/4_7e10Ge1_WD40/PF16529_5/4e02Ge1_
MSGNKKVEIRISRKRLTREPGDESPEALQPAEKVAVSSRLNGVIDESAVVEVESQDVVRLILQYLKENGLLRSFHVLQEEADVFLNGIENKEDVVNKAVNGELGVLLKLASEVDTPPALLFTLFEHVALELLDTGDKEALAMFMKSNAVFDAMAKKEPLRYRRIETLKAKAVKPSSEELWGEVSKAKRRKTIAKDLTTLAPKVAPGRLLHLLGIAIKAQRNQGIIPGGSKYNLFEGLTLSERSLCEMPATIMRHTIKLEVKETIVRSVVFAHEGNSVITGDSAGEILVWSWMTGTLRSDLKYQMEGFVMNHYIDDETASAVTALTLSHDGKVLASGDENGTVKLWRIEDGKLAKTLPAVHKKAINSIEFHPLHPQVLTASADGTAKITLLKNKGATLKTFEGHNGFVSSAFYEGKKAKTVVTCCSDGYFRVFKYDSGDLINKVTPPKAQSSLSGMGIEMMIRDPRDEHQIFICQRSPKIYCFSTRGDLIKTYDSQSEEGFVAITASPQGEFVMGLTEKGTQVAFNCTTGEQVSVLPSRVNTSASCGLLYHSSQNIAALWGSDNQLMILQS